MFISKLLAIIYRCIQNITRTKWDFQRQPQHVALISIHSKLMVDRTIQILNLRISHTNVWRTLPFRHLTEKGGMDVEGIEVNEIDVFSRKHGLD